MTNASDACWDCARQSKYEYFNPATGQPLATAAGTFGWTVAVFIDLAIQASGEEDNGIWEGD